MLPSLVLKVTGLTFFKVEIEIHLIFNPLITVSSSATAHGSGQLPKLNYSQRSTSLSSLLCLSHRSLFIHNKISTITNPPHILHSIVDHSVHSWSIDRFYRDCEWKSTRFPPQTDQQRHQRDSSKVPLLSV